MRLESCFLILKYHENCNAMSSFTVICHVPLRYETLICMFSLVHYGFYLLFIFLKINNDIYMFLLGWLKRD